MNVGVFPEIIWLMFAFEKYPYYFAPTKLILIWQRRYVNKFVHIFCHIKISVATILLQQYCCNSTMGPRVPGLRVRGPRVPGLRVPGPRVPGPQVAGLRGPGPKVAGPRSRDSGGEVGWLGGWKKGTDGWNPRWNPGWNPGWNLGWRGVWKNCEKIDLNVRKWWKNRARNTYWNNQK